MSFEGPWSDHGVRARLHHEYGYSPLPRNHRQGRAETPSVDIRPAGYQHAKQKADRRIAGALERMLNDHTQPRQGDDDRTTGPPGSSGHGRARGTRWTGYCSFSTALGRFASPRQPDSPRCVVDTHAGSAGQQASSTKKRKQTNLRRCSRPGGSRATGVSAAIGGSLMTAIRKPAAVNASDIPCSGRCQFV